MTPNFLNETRNFFETEMAFWKAQATELSEKNVAQAEAFVKEARERLQSAADAQSNLVVSLWKHNMDALERGAKLATSAFSLPA